MLIALPNAQFHLTPACAILRMAGVAVGKAVPDGYHVLSTRADGATQTHHWNTKAH